MKETEIVELIHKAQNHDEVAMESLFRIYKPKVTAISREYFLIGSDTDDLVQEGMIALYKAICVYEEEKNHNFSAFASMFIHRTLQNAVKMANRKKNSPLNTYLPINNDDDNEDDSFKIIISDEDSNFEQSMIDKEMHTILLSKIKNVLSHEQYLILGMFLNGQSYQQMAERLNISRKQVDNTLQSIKKKLKSIKGEV